MKTIVLIENDPLTRQLLSQCLSGEGWRVLEADNGESGLNLVVEHKPAAVLCDIRTPRRNGFKVCRFIREQPPLQSTQVVLTSVSRFGNDRDSAFAAGAQGYLVKPILPAELLQTLAAAGAAESTATPEAPTDAPAPEVPTLIRFWGVRGSIPTPGSETAGYGGNTSCVEMRVGEQVLILDAGSGIRRLGQSLMKEFKDKPLSLTMLVTHTHWDHIQGFPFFIPAYSPKVSVRILGYEGAVHGLRGALFEQMQSAFFPIALHQMASRITFEELDDMQFQLGAVKGRAVFANHPGICLGYRLSTPGGDVVYLPDHEAYERHEVERQKVAGENSPVSIEYARQQDENMIAFLRGADVVIADSQYDAAEYPMRLGWGHTCVDDTVQNAVRAGVKELFLFHHDPDHHDEKIDAMVARARERVAEQGSPLIVTAAREGAEIILKKPAKP
jgi:phosphoribosyl 1,2-cyclic phosphodiesterase/CheY-like chemotaxis protein